MPTRRPAGIAYTTGATSLTWSEYDKRSSELAAVLGAPAASSRATAWRCCFPDGPTVHRRLPGRGEGRPGRRRHRSPGGRPRDAPSPRLDRRPSPSVPRRPRRAHGRGAAPVSRLGRRGARPSRGGPRSRRRRHPAPVLVDGAEAGPADPAVPRTGGASDPTTSSCSTPPPARPAFPSASCTPRTAGSTFTSWPPCRVASATTRCS